MKTKEKIIIRIKGTKAYPRLRKIKHRLKSMIKSDYSDFKIRFENEFGYKLNVENPVSFSEKIQWRKLNQLPKDIIYAECSDKYEVRKFVSKKSNCKLIPLIGVYDNIEQIDFKSLPDEYVIKTTHDSGTVFIVEKSSKEDYILEIKKKLWLSMQHDYGCESRERHYSNIQPRIIIEKLMLDKGELPSDIKIHCFHGEAKFIQVANSSHTTNDIYDTEWNELDVVYLNKKSSIVHLKPDNLSELLSISRSLSVDFDYVRVDLYTINNDVYFGELTFAPNRGYAKIIPSEFDIEWGKYWKI
ncbi:glycosyl transferase [Vibrio inusitatus NBRC 102082]|uniref:Glycosyl transferase n=1 Tax=Vibrio inusitatus NBRC 102082 TaxID=1219070 RepID=A0A4Y3HZB7_9VIBR|nr:ATP-grasp fold amidoligase family protein [Vibrio inusitatus]GEA52361.1 glycosyl transferase [Vibrio inusitatus NBRC 102082]